ncbi:unnamed protein product [Cochlearia groenlandica]
MADSNKEIENQILEAGEKLIDPPSSLSELLPFLDKLYISLSDVEQSPAKTMQNALNPVMNALVAGKIFKHSDADVKVAVAACISEITRITAPEAPYDDDQMKEVFKLIVSSFEDLGDESSRSYAKRVSILETVAKVRSCVVMLDLECDALLIEMFHSLLKTIRDHHPGNVFSSMENIMTLVLEESEDIPPERLTPILHYVRKDIEVIYRWSYYLCYINEWPFNSLNLSQVPQVSRRLAEVVLSNCASKLKTYLTEAVKSSDVSLGKYNSIVASICAGTFSALQQDQLLANEKEEFEEKAAEISTPERTDAPKDETGKSGVSNGVTQHNDSSVDAESTKKQDDANGKDEPQQLDNPSTTDSNNTHEEKPDFENQTEGKGKEDSSVTQADSSKTSDLKEETEPVALLDSKDVPSSLPDVPSLLPDDLSANAAISSENEKKTNVEDLPSKTSGDETTNVSIPLKAEDLLEEILPKEAANQEKTENSTEEAKPSATDTTEEVSKEPNTSESKVTKKSGKKAVSSSKARPTVLSSKKSTTQTKASKQSGKKAEESDNVQEASTPVEEEKKTESGEAMDEDSLHGSSGDDEKPAGSSGKSASKSKKVVKQPLEESHDTNTKRKRSLGKEKASDLKTFDKNLVGSKVRVWWPMDQAYYKGVVNSYDSAKKKHLVCYDDGDQELLYLKKQKWFFQHELESSEDEEATDQTGQDEEASTTPHKKKAKTTGKQAKMDSSAKKSGGAGSSKSKAASASKSGKKSKEDKTEEADREEDDSSEEETPKTVTKLGGAKAGSSKSKKDASNISKSRKPKDQGDSGTSKAASSKKKEEPSKTATKSKAGPAKSSSAKGKAKPGSASTPSSKAKESSDAESESEETPKASETTAKGKSVSSGKSQGSQAKSGKKRKR